MAFRGEKTPPPSAQTTDLTGRLGLRPLPALPALPPPFLPPRTPHDSPEDPGQLRGDLQAPACLTRPPASLGTLFSTATNLCAVVTAAPSVCADQACYQTPSPAGVTSEGLAVLRPPSDAHMAPFLCHPPWESHKAIVTPWKTMGLAASHRTLQDSVTFDAGLRGASPS